MPDEMVFSLCPLLVLHGEPSGNLTPLHFLPIPIAMEAPRLTRLAAAPFSVLRFLGPKFDTGFTYPLDFWFTGGPLRPTPRQFLRPVVIWSSRDDVEQLASRSLGGAVPFVEVVSERRELVDRL